MFKWVSLFLILQAASWCVILFLLTKGNALFQIFVNERSVFVAWQCTFPHSQHHRKPLGLISVEIVSTILLTLIWYLQIFIFSPLWSIIKSNAFELLNFSLQTTIVGKFVGWPFCSLLTVLSCYQNWMLFMIFSAWNTRGG